MYLFVLVSPPNQLVNDGLPILVDKGTIVLFTKTQNNGHHLIDRFIRAQLVRHILGILAREIRVLNITSTQYIRD